MTYSKVAAHAVRPNPCLPHNRKAPKPYAIWKGYSPQVHRKFGVHGRKTYELSEGMEFLFGAPKWAFLSLFLYLSQIYTGV
jgi:hypothetical protein